MKMKINVTNIKVAPLERERVMKEMINHIKNWESWNVV
jgi:hypothetical protein